MYFINCQGHFDIFTKKPVYIKGFEYFKFDPLGKDLKIEDIIDFNPETKKIFTQKGNFKLTESKINILEADTIETIPNQDISITTIMDDELIIEPPRKTGQQIVVCQLTAGKHTLSFLKVGGYKIYSKNYISNNLCITVKRPKAKTTQNFILID